jgi:hypothetical protein
MPKIQMEVIAEPEPKTASILVLSQANMASKTPYAVFSGGGETDYICGGCRTTLAAGVGRGQVINIVFKCLRCGSYNIVRGTS